MVKTFCDICGMELTCNDIGCGNFLRYKLDRTSSDTGPEGKINVKVCSETHDLCRSCIARIIFEGECIR